jgi:hypothetical protein
MGSFERFKTKTHFNSLKRLVGVTALAALAVKLLTVALATAAGGGTPWRTARPRSARPRSARPRSASWSTRWCGCCATTPAVCGPGATRASGYVTASFSALGGGSWLLIDWDAIRLPTAITAPR